MVPPPISPFYAFAVARTRAFTGMADRCLEAILVVASFPEHDRALIDSLAALLGVWEEWQVREVVWPRARIAQRVLVERWFRHNLESWSPTVISAVVGCLRLPCRAIHHFFSAWRSLRIVPSWKALSFTLPPSVTPYPFRPCPSCLPSARPLRIFLRFAYLAAHPNTVGAPG